MKTRLRDAGFFRYLILFLFSPLLLRIVYPLTDGVHELLAELLPALFHSFNRVTEKDAYEAQRTVIWLAAGIITLLTVCTVSMIFDNDRNEYMIKQTDGFYTLREGFGIYASRFLRTDIAISLTVPLILALPSFIPRDLAKLLDTETSHIGSRLEELLSGFFMSTTVFTDALGGVFGVALILALSVLFRIAAVWLGIERWRGLWLSDIDRQ